jgi:hypothetical protein
MLAIDEQIHSHQARLDDVERRLQKLPFETDLLNEVSRSNNALLFIICGTNIKLVC